MPDQRGGPLRVCSVSSACNNNLLLIIVSTVRVLFVRKRAVSFIQYDVRL